MLKFSVRDPQMFRNLNRKKKLSLYKLIVRDDVQVFLPNKLTHYVVLLANR